MSSVFKFGTSFAGMKSLDAFTTPVNDPTDYQYHEGVKRRKPSSGSELWVGRPWGELTWDALPQSMRDSLRSLCSGASAEIYCQLPTNNNNSQTATYRGTVIWQEDEKAAELGMSYAIVLTVRNLVPASS